MTAIETNDRRHQSTEPSSIYDVDRSSVPPGGSAMPVNVNTRIPEFATTAFHGGNFVPVSSTDLDGRWSVVFFYPADFTFVCPTELGDLADSYADFQRLGVEVYAVSTDTHFVHKAWHDASDTIGKIRYPMLGDASGAITNG